MTRMLVFVPMGNMKIMHFLKALTKVQLSRDQLSAEFCKGLIPIF